MLLCSPPAGAAIGPFAPRAEYPVPGFDAPGLTISDFDGDGHPDVVVSGGRSYTETDVALLSGSASGELGGPAAIDSGGEGPGGLASADLNGDGRDDLVVAESWSDEVSVLLTQPGGGFSAPASYPVPPGRPSDIAIADFTGDRLPDLAVTPDECCDGGIFLIPGRGDGTFGPGELFPIHDPGTSLASGDLNDDGRADLVVFHISQTSSETAWVLLGTGSPEHPFEDPIATPPAGDVSFEDGGEPIDGVLADFDADGNLDLATIQAHEFAATDHSNDSDVAVYRGVGDGTFARPATFTTGDPPSGIAAEDFDGDGAIDLVVSHGGDTSDEDSDLLLLAGDGAGGFTKGGRFALHQGSGTVQTARLDQGPSPDLVITSRSVVQTLLDDAPRASGEATPTLRAIPSPGADAGRLIDVRAELTDARWPTGRLRFALYGPGDPACAGPAAQVESVPISGLGDQRAPAVAPAVPGTYRWVVSYAGDAVNAAAASGCGAATKISGDPPDDPADPPPPAHPEPPGDRGPVAHCGGREADVAGTEEADRLRGTRGDDVIVAGAGRDHVRGGGGDDLICLGAGEDRAWGGHGGDRIVGGAGGDRVGGGPGRDRLLGRSGPDRLRGGRGRDRCVKGSGRDHVHRSCERPR